MSASFPIPTTADAAALDTKRAVRWCTVAWCVIGAAAIGLAALAWATAGADGAALINQCGSHAHPSALACLDGRAPSSLRLELAGSGTRVSCQLRGGTPPAAPSFSERACIEVRIDRARHELRVVDAKVLIPLYLILSLLLAAWVRLGASAEDRRRAPAVGWGIALTATLLAVLDLKENAEALKLLAAAEMKDALVPAALASLDAWAAEARAASLAKWGAAVPWALALAAGAALAARRADDRPVFRALCRLSALLLAAGALALAAGGAAALWMEAFAAGVRLLSAGFTAVFGGVACMVLAIACSRRLRRRAQRSPQ